jgi:hypothetical protein
MTDQLLALKSAIEILDSIQNGGSSGIAEHLNRIEEIKKFYHRATDTATIIAHPHVQVKVELLNDEKCVYASESFNTMTEARSWLSERGIPDDSVTWRVDQSCDKAADSSGYLGIYRCAHCKDRCVE